LVAIDAYVVGGITVMKRRSPIADLVAHRRLELDDVGALIPKQLRRGGAAQYAREGGDLHAGKSATRRIGACLPVPCLCPLSPWCTEAFSTHSVPQVCRGGNGRRHEPACRELPERRRLSVRTVHRNATRVPWRQAQVLHNPTVLLFPFSAPPSPQTSRCPRG